MELPWPFQEIRDCASITNVEYAYYSPNESVGNIFNASFIDISLLPASLQQRISFNQVDFYEKTKTFYPRIVLIAACMAAQLPNSIRCEKLLEKISARKPILEKTRETCIPDTELTIPMLSAIVTRPLFQHNLQDLNSIQNDSVCSRDLENANFIYFRLNRIYKNNNIIQEIMRCMDEDPVEGRPCCIWSSSSSTLPRVHLFIKDIFDPNTHYMFLEYEKTSDMLQLENETNPDASDYAYELQSNEDINISIILQLCMNHEGNEVILPETASITMKTIHSIKQVFSERYSILTDKIFSLIGIKSDTDVIHIINEAQERCILPIFSAESMNSIDILAKDDSNDNIYTNINIISEPNYRHSNSSIAVDYNLRTLEQYISEGQRMTTIPSPSPLVDSADSYQCHRPQRQVGMALYVRACKTLLLPPPPPSESKTITSTDIDIDIDIDVSINTDNNNNATKNNNSTIATTTAISTSLFSFPSDWKISLRNKFNKVNYLILVPKFNTLKQQTKERIEKIPGLVREGENTQDLVLLYGGSGDNLKIQCTRIGNEIMKNRNDLFVLIVDECHYAPTANAIPLLHNKDLHHMDNFLVLLVSATPYNCLSVHTHLEDANRIIWSKIQRDPLKFCSLHIGTENGTIDDQSNTNIMTTSSTSMSYVADKPAYVGTEFYFRSIGFPLCSYEFSVSVSYTDANKTTESIVVNIGQYRTAASTATAATRLECEYNNNKFGNNQTFGFTVVNFPLFIKSIKIEKNDFIRSLGFTSTSTSTASTNVEVDVIELTNMTRTVCSESSITIDSKCPTASQHLRQDLSYANIYENICSEHQEIDRIGQKKKNTKKSSKRAVWEGIQLDGISGLDEVMDTFHSIEWMEPKSGFAIVLDYLISMAYFGSCRINGTNNNSNSNDDDDGGDGEIAATAASVVVSLQNIDTDSSALSVTDDQVMTFLNMLQQCVYFYDNDPKYGDACNLGPLLDTTLKLYIASARDDLKGSSDDNHDDVNGEGDGEVTISNMECLKFILSQKMVGELSSESSTEESTWYTETDRIVKMLLVDRKPAPMVLLRVYDHDENRSLQRILRNGLLSCRLIIRKNNNNNNNSSSSCNDAPAFSVMGDIADTKLLDVLEPYYRDQYNISTNDNEEGGQALLFIKDIPKIREERLIKQQKEEQQQQQTENKNKGNSKSKSNNSKQSLISMDLKYEDLANVPCLIILCEKGRMGDTFPHNLRVLDLRLRTGGSLSCFIQEIGRMCRYPQYREYNNNNNGNHNNNHKNPISSPIDIANFLSSKPTMEELQSNGASNGLLLKDADTESFLGIFRPQDTLDWEHIYNNASSTSTRKVQQCSLVHPLPYALVTPKVFEALQKAFTERETATQSSCTSSGDIRSSDNSRSDNHFSAWENYRENNRIESYLRMTDGIDSYLSSKTLEKGFGYTIKRKETSHYDITNEIQYRHPRRLLLSAECQIGKTGAYLHFLHLLRNTIEGVNDDNNGDYNDGNGINGDGDGNILSPIPDIPVISKSIQWYEWSIPYWRRIQIQNRLSAVYDMPKYGKYHEKLAKQRLDLVILSAFRSLVGSGGNGNDDGDQKTFVELYIDAINTTEMTITVEGMKRLDADGLIRFANWDGRLQDDNAYRIEHGAQNFASNIVNKSISGNGGSSDSSDLRKLIDNISIHGVRAISLASTACYGREENMEDTVETTGYDDDENNMTTSCNNTSNTNNSSDNIKFTINTVNSKEIRPVSPYQIGFQTVTALGQSTIERFDIDYRMENVIKTKTFGVIISLPTVLLGETIKTKTTPDIESQLRNLFNCHRSSSSSSNKSSESTRKIRSWIFTPTFAGTGKAGPEMKLLFRDKAFSPLVRWEDYGEILVVRRSQFSSYREYFGSTHIIVAMPDKIEVESMLKFMSPYERHGMDEIPAETGTDTQTVTYSAEMGGVGYSRFFCQIFASHFDMEAIWMMDDNSEIRPVTFADVMIHIESLHYKDITSNITMSTTTTASTNSSADSDSLLTRSLAAMIQSKNYQACPCSCPSEDNCKIRKDTSSSVFPLSSSMTTTPVKIATNLSEVMGSSSAYGIIGMARGSSWRQDVCEPFKVSYSVYSFFLLNIKDTVANGCFFPCRPIWEDIEFNQLLDEKGLVVCKMQMYSHSKPMRRMIDEPQKTLIDTLFRMYIMSIYSIQQVCLCNRADNDSCASPHLCNVIRDLFQMMMSKLEKTTTNTANNSSTNTTTRTTNTSDADTTTPTISTPKQAAIINLVHVPPVPRMIATEYGEQILPYNFEELVYQVCCCSSNNEEEDDEERDDGDGSNSNSNSGNSIRVLVFPKVDYIRNYDYNFQIEHIHINCKELDDFIILEVISSSHHSNSLPLSSLPLPDDGVNDSNDNDNIQGCDIPIHSVANIDNNENKNEIDCEEEKSELDDEFEVEAISEGKTSSSVNESQHVLLSLNNNDSNSDNDSDSDIIPALMDVVMIQIDESSPITMTVIPTPPPPPIVITTSTSTTATSTSTTATSTPPLSSSLSEQGASNTNNNTDCNSDMNNANDICGITKATTSSSSDLSTSMNTDTDRSNGNGNCNNNNINDDVSSLPPPPLKRIRLTPRPSFSPSQIFSVGTAYGITSSADNTATATATSVHTSNRMDTVHGDKELHISTSTDKQPLLIIIDNDINSSSSSSHEIMVSEPLSSSEDKVNKKKKSTLIPPRIPRVYPSYVDENKGSNIISTSTSTNVSGSQKRKREEVIDIDNDDIDTNGVDDNTAYHIDSSTNMEIGMDIDNGNEIDNDIDMVATPDTSGVHSDSNNSQINLISNTDSNNTDTTTSINTSSNSTTSDNIQKRPVTFDEVTKHMTRGDHMRVFRNEDNCFMSEMRQNPAYAMTPDMIETWIPDLKKWDEEMKARGIVQSKPVYPFNNYNNFYNWPLTEFYKPPDLSKPARPPSPPLNLSTASSLEIMRINEPPSFSSSSSFPIQHTHTLSPIMSPSNGSVPSHPSQPYDSQS
eukprot:gene1358-2629_t